MKRILLLLSGFLIIMASAGCAASQTPVWEAPAGLDSLAFPTPEPISQSGRILHTSVPASLPFDLLSLDHIFETLESLTAIEPYSGWRSSGTQGERVALDYMAARVAEFPFLGALGTQLERQDFHVFTATELWETRLFLTVGGEQVEVPADGLRGHRDDLDIARRCDSDGQLNDSQRDPVIVEGSVRVVRSSEEIEGLSADVSGEVLLVDYAAIDRVILGKGPAAALASKLLEAKPAGLVLVTSNSTTAGESHGSFVGDVSALNYVEDAPTVPTLYTRLEDLDIAGIQQWGDLAAIESVRLVWDADLFSPGTSSNLMALIPGQDDTKVVVLGAHIDSPNAPGAMDDGSGSAILLEVARVLNEAQYQPPTSVALVWFGSEELGLYGSYHFVSTHQELLDRSLAMLQVDCLLRPMDGIEAYLNLIGWSYGRFGEERGTWPEYLQDKADQRDIFVYAGNFYGIESDNSAFTGFDVPSANLIYMNYPEMEAIGGVHYAGHMHDPYDTVELAREVADVLDQMAQVALSAVIDTGRDRPSLSVTPSSDRRAVFVASHTEAVHMAPTTLTDLGMALAWQGFDVDMVPYGEGLTPAHLHGADLVFALPIIDYPSPVGEVEQYDEAWQSAEVEALVSYVEHGGLLILVNSANRLKYSNLVKDPNEDWEDMNALSTRFGVRFTSNVLPGTQARTKGRHTLVAGVRELDTATDNSVPFTYSQDRQ